MIIFKNPNDMLPSEMATYIAALHNEIEILAKKALFLKTQILLQQPVTLEATAQKKSY